MTESDDKVDDRLGDLRSFTDDCGVPTPVRVLGLKIEDVRMKSLTYFNASPIVYPDGSPECADPDRKSEAHGRGAALGEASDGIVHFFDQRATHSSRAARVGGFDAKREAPAMPDAMTDTFLEGQGIPVNLHEIETEMVKLWGPAAEQVGGPEVENPHVTRVALANLVVACLDGDGEWLGRVMETVIARDFPAGRSWWWGRRTRGVGWLRRSRPCAISRPRACRRSLGADRAPRRARMPSTCCPAQCVLCSRPSCRWSSGGSAILGRMRGCSATWPANARG